MSRIKQPLRPMKSVTVELPVETASWLAENAEKRMCSMAAVIREVLAKHVATQIKKDA